MRNIIYRVLVLSGLVFLLLPVHAQDSKKIAKLENQLISAVEKYNVKDLAAADSLLQGILAEDPSNDAAWYWSALVRVARNDVAGAEEHMKKATELDPDNFWYREHV